MSAGDFGRIDSAAVGEFDQEILVSKHMLEHAREKVGRARRRESGPVRYL